MPVYVDVLVAVNGFVNYLLLESARRFLKIDYSRGRIFLSAALGGLFALKIFLPQLPMFADFAVRFAMCVLMTFAAFGFGGVKSFIKKTAAFFAVNLFYGGFMSAVFNFINPNGMVYKNGTVYFDIDFKILAVTSVASFAVVSLIMKMISRKSPPQSIFNVEINHNSQKCRGRGFVDSGNSLREMFSDTPVIVADVKAVKNIVSGDILRYIKTGDPDLLNENIRLIPSSTVAGNILLPAFKADLIKISNLKKSFVYENIYIAVSSVSFFGGEFEFLLNSELTEDNNYEKTNNENQTFYKKADRGRYTLHKRT